VYDFEVGLPGMSAVLDGTFRMGAGALYAEEGPERRVEVAPFRIDLRPVSNRDFAAFVKATRHVTAAERAPSPEHYPDVDPVRLKPGALVFQPPRGAATHWRDWWAYVPGATWLKPDGKTSIYRGRLDHPVVCVGFEDAIAYARWAGKDLPTEAEWELAARGGLDGATYAWGDERAPGGRAMANTWIGVFPHQNLAPPGQKGTSESGVFPANGHGVFDMIGNVWEWTQDYFVASGRSSGCCGASASYDPDLPGVKIPRRVVKGGSHLCHESYCDRYRPAARQPQMEDTAATHIGFRCVIRP
jgi:formylglycine-generating enzyme